MSQNKCQPARLFHKLHVPENCNPDLAPILLLHGICTTHENWATIVPTLGERTQRNIIMVDLRNHGESEWTKESSLDLFVTDLEHFLSSLDCKKCIIIGHSVGGRIACGFTLKMPNMVELLIVEDSTLSKQFEFGNFSSVFKTIIKMLDFVPKSYDEKDIQKMIGKHLKRIMPDLPIDGISCFLPLYRDDKGKIQFHFNAAAFEQNAGDESLSLLDLKKYKAYTGPALFLHGENSPAPVFEDETIPIYFPNAELVDVPKSIHTPHLEAADTFLQLVCDFISKNGETVPKSN